MKERCVRTTSRERDLKIACISGFEAWWGKYPANVLDLDDGMTVGGGEENFLRCAAGLKELGHDVDAWHYGESGVWRGVKFRSMQEDLYFTLQSTKYDCVASWSALRALEWAPKGAKRLFVQQLNDLTVQGLWSSVDCVVSPSENHAQQLAGWGWRKRPYAVVHNGLDEKDYNPVGEFEQGPPQWSSRPMHVGYWSSPDRGLHHVLKAWPAVTQKLPQAHLHVFYEIDRYLKYAVESPGVMGDRARLLDSLLPRAKADKTITFHGAVPRNRLRKTQFQCRVMCYPYVPLGYCEGFCGSVNQGIAAGCHVMTTQQDALPSLYDGAVTWMPKEPEKLDEQLPGYILQGLLNEDWSIQRVSQAREHRFNFTWERATKEMEEACKGESWKWTGDE